MAHPDLVTVPTIRASDALLEAAPLRRLRTRQRAGSLAVAVRPLSPRWRLMPRCPLALAALLALTSPHSARAATPSPTAHAALFLDAYAVGLRVMRMRAELDLTEAGYAVLTNYHTTGLVGALVSSHQVTTVSGFWRSTGVAPRTFRSDGDWSGKPRHVLIDFAGITPDVRVMVPANNQERDPVPPDATRDTEDTLSPMAQLSRQIAQTGRCDGQVATYDGRRVVDLTVRTIGMETLPSTPRSSFVGQALRCDFVGLQVAGFLHGAGSDARRPRRGSAWFAPLEPGGAPLPVRVIFATPWVGQITMYVTKPPPA